MTAWSSGAGPWRRRATFVTPRASRSRRSPSVSVARRQRSRRTSTIRRARRRGPSRHATSVSAAAVAPTPSRATARVTPTRTARPAIPARSRGAGIGSGCWRRWGSGSIGMAGCRPRTTGRARTPASAGERRLHGWMEGGGPRRASLPACSEHGMQRARPPVSRCPTYARCGFRRKPRIWRLDRSEP